MLRAVALCCVVVGMGACRHKGAGTCARDIDCPAASDCRAGRCVPRVRWRPASELVRPAPSTTPISPIGAAAAVPAGPAHLTVSVPFVRDGGVAPATPTLVPAPVDEPTRARVPLWQERRRSF